MEDLDIRKVNEVKVAPAAQPVNNVQVLKKPQATKRSFSKMNLVLVLVVLLLGVSAFITYKYIKANDQVNQLRKNPSQVVGNSTQMLLNKVGQLVVLPNTGESPSIALVKDSSKLQSQPFFSHAQDGDYVIVYAHAKVAILYRPSVNKIIEDASTD